MKTIPMLILGSLLSLSAYAGQMRIACSLVSSNSPSLSEGIILQQGLDLRSSVSFGARTLSDSNLFSKKEYLMLTGDKIPGNEAMDIEVSFGFVPFIEIPGSRGADQDEQMLTRKFTISSDDRGLQLKNWSYSKDGHNYQVACLIGDFSKFDDSGRGIEQFNMLLLDYIGESKQPKINNDDILKSPDINHLKKPNIFTLEHGGIYR